MPEQQQGRQPSEEEMEALREKVKNMSPEELKEFQKKQCIFCQIIDGKIQAKKIYEDEKSLAVLDINPANPGHILLLPKEHYSVMPQIPKDEIGHLFMVARFLSNAVLKSLEASGTNLIVANGPAAGQKAQHFMIHIIPRKEDDNVEFTLPQKKHSDKDLNTVSAKISARLSEILQVKKAQPVKSMQGPQQAVPQIAAPSGKPEPRVKGPKKAVEAIIQEEPETTKLEKEIKETVPKKAKKPAKKQAKKKPKKKQEEPEELSNESEKGLEKSKTSQKEPKQQPPKEEQDEEVNLDDIANVLGL